MLDQPTVDSHFLLGKNELLLLKCLNVLGLLICLLGLFDQLILLSEPEVLHLATLVHTLGYLVLEGANLLFQWT